MDTITNFQGIWDHNRTDLALDELSRELNTLRMALRDEAHSLEHDVAVAQLALAEGAALAMDGPKMLEHLRNAGEWSLRMAEKNGARGPAAAIRVSMAL